MSHTSSPHAVDRITPLTSLVRLLEENGMKPHEIPSHQTIIIGDVHGCLKELKELIERAEFDQERGDQIVFVGDLIGKGPFSLQVLDFVLSLPAKIVVGNHDDVVLRWYRKVFLHNPEEVAIRPEYLKLAEQMNQEEWNLLVGSPYFRIFPRLFRFAISDKDINDHPDEPSHSPWFRESAAKVPHGFSLQNQLSALSLQSETPLQWLERDVVVVHAGFLPGKDIHEQKPQHMMNIRNVLPDGSFSKEQKSGSSWASLWPTASTTPFVIFGHDAVRGIQIHGGAIGLDSGCVYGGLLSAIVFPQQEIIQVKAERVYSEPEIKL